MAKDHYYWDERLRAERAAVDLEDRVTADPFTEAEAEQVCGVIALHGLGRLGFELLDGKPGYFSVDGRSYHQCQWHARLRRTRNNHFGKLDPLLRQPKLKVVVR